MRLSKHLDILVCDQQSPHEMGVIVRFALNNVEIQNPDLSKSAVDALSYKKTNADLHTNEHLPRSGHDYTPGPTRLYRRLPDTSLRKASLVFRNA